MAYIGNAPAEAYSNIAYQDFGTQSGTTFTLDFPAGAPGELEVFVNNVRQEPSVAYTVSGTTLTMTGTVAASDDFYVVFQGKAQQTVTHPANTALAATTGTFSGDLTVDTSTLKVDSTNNYVGIGTASPSRTLTVNSGTTNTAFRLESTDAEVAMQFYDGTKTSTIQGGTSGLSFYPNTTVDKALAITATGKVETTNRDYGFFNHATNVTLADEASIVLNPVTLGVGMLVIYETASGTNGLFRIGYSSCAAISGAGSATLAAADQDGAVCVFSSSHTLTIKNRLGASKGFSIAMFCAGNGFAGQENKMSITYTVDKFINDNTEKLVGLRCVDASDNVFIVDKRIPIVDGTTDAQYVQQAFTAAQAEINEWASGMSVQGMVFNPDSSSLSEAP